MKRDMKISRHIWRHEQAKDMRTGSDRALGR
jgi:hypothetical protein